jgi:hypothetical protein
MSKNYSGILNSLLPLETGFSAIFHTGIILHGNLFYSIQENIVHGAPAPSRALLRQQLVREGAGAPPRDNLFLEIYIYRLLFTVFRLLSSVFHLSH